MESIVGIKDISGNILQSVPLTEPCEHVEELMQSDHITLSWESDQSDILPIGAYIEYKGEKYSLLEPYSPIQNDELKFTYQPQFKSVLMSWGKIPFFMYTYSADNEITNREPDWELTDNPVNFMSVICKGIKNETGEEWTYSVDASLPASATLSFQSVDIFSALNSIANAFETEWWADKANKVLHLSKAEHGTPITLEVGVNINTPSVTNSKEGYYTRFYAFGSTRNIVQDYNGANVNNLVNKRLTLDPVKYPNGYKDIRAGLQQGEIFSKILIFDDVYPSSDLETSDVRVRLMWTIDESTGEKIQVGTDDDGNPIYDQYAIWYFRIPGFTFNNTTYSKDNPNGMLIAGKTLSAHFETGALQGREFELIYHDKAETVSSADGTSIVLSAGDYEIKFKEEGTYIIPAITALIPSDGDHVILFNIRMPQEYVNAAYTELEDAMDKEIARLSSDLNNYQFSSNPVVFYENNPGLSLGRKVTYVNGDYSYSTRVIKLVTKLDYENDCKQDITIGNDKIKGNTQEIKEEVASANKDINLLAVINDMTSSLQQSYQRTQKMMLEGFASIKDMWRFDPKNPDTIFSKYNVYTEKALSSKGLSLGDGSGGDGSATALYQLNDVAKNASGTDVLGAAPGKVLTYGEDGKWYAADAVGLDETALASYLTNNNYAKKSDIPSLSGYATEQWVLGKGYITSAALTGYATQSWVNTQLGGYATSSALKAVSDKLDDFLTGTDTDNVINKWKELEAFLTGFQETDTLAGALNGKVDKVAGKGLSSNDFTDALLAKLNGIAEGANKYILPVAKAAVLGGVMIGSTLTASATGVLDLPTVGTAGTYFKVTTDAYGRVTSGSNPTTLAGFGITDGVNDAPITGTGNAITSVSLSGHTLTFTKGDTFLTKATFDDLFEKVNIGTSEQPTYAIRAKYGLYTDEFMSSKGLNPGTGGSGGGSDYDRLDAWSDYTADKAGYVLSAGLGNDLNTRLKAVEAGGATSVTTTGSGNVVTGVSKSGNVITVTKGITALTGITKAQVEAVLTGNITTHVHNQYLTSHQSLANYMRFNYHTSYVAAGFNDIVLSQKASETYIEFWDDISSTGSTANGWWNLMAGKFIKSGGTASQVLMADGSVQSHWKAADVTSATSDVGMITPLAMNQWTSKTFVTALGTSGNYLTWTKNGVTNNITVPYASNADKLDGVEGNIYFKGIGRDSGTINLNTYTARVFRELRTTEQTTENCPLPGYLGFLNLWDASNVAKMQLVGNPNSLFYRFQQSSKAEITNSWKQFAFTDSNVASATKLATARTINGTNFDGTANITTAYWGTARNIKIGEVTKSVNGSANVEFTRNDMKVAAGAEVVFYGTPTANGWYRIATTPMSISNACSILQITAAANGYHSNIILYAGISYHNAAGASLNILGSSAYNNIQILKVRIVYPTSYNNNYAYLEVQTSQALATTFTIKSVLGGGWNLATSMTAGSIPSGYLNKEITPYSGSMTNTGDIVSMGILKSTRYGNVVQIGSRNASWAHFYSNLPFWFNTSMTIQGNCLPYTNNTFTSGNVSQRWSNVYATAGNFSNYIDIGSIRLTYDSTNNAIKVSKTDGTAAGLYTEGFLSSKGLNAGSGTGGSGTDYDRLDAWSDYAASKAGWVLSAGLGNDLNTRLKAVEQGGAMNVTTTGSGNAVTAVSKSGTTITVTKGATFSLSNHTHSYIEAKPNYSFTTSTLPNSFDLGVSAGFVADNSGFGSYGSVLTVRTYTGGGGTLQLYAPYSSTYGGTHLKARFGNYSVNSGNSWTELKQLAWVGESYTKSESDGKYVTLSTAQTITGKKKFNTVVELTDGSSDHTFSSLPNLLFHIPGVNYSRFVLSTDGLLHLLSGNATSVSGVHAAIVASSFKRFDGTDSQFLMADGSVATKHTLSAITNLGWSGTSGQIPTINTLAYWNGQYSNGSSNLQYCDRGRFGDIVTQSLSGLDSRYVNASGDTMTGKLTISHAATESMIINSTGVETFIRVQNAGASKSCFGWKNDASLGTYMYSSACGKALGIKDNGTPHFQGNTLWHAGNDGSSSGLDADLLDGKHLSDILASNVASATKLATARTIWGQSFNGTANVSGALLGATTISASGVIATLSLDPGFRVISGSTNKLAMGYRSSDAGAYIFNYVSSRYLGVSDKATPVFGKGSECYMVPHTIRLFSKNDYEHWVVLLCETTSTATGIHRVTGKVFTEIGGGTRYQAADINLWYSRWSSTGADGTLVLNTYGQGIPWNLVTCTYGGKTYYALQHTNAQAVSAYFVGTFTNALFTAVKYYTAAHDGTAAVVNNSEINGSIKDVTTSVLSANGTAYALTSSNVASATKLQTARTLWGQSFNGTANVSGNMTGVGSITPASDSAYNIGTLSNQYQWIYAHGIFAKAGSEFSIGANNDYHVRITTAGNVGIGTTSPGYKLEVNGSVKATGSVTATSYVYADGWFQNNLANRGLYNAAGDARWYWNGTGWYSDKTIIVCGRLTIDSTGKVRPYSTSTRRSGMYGIYDSTKIGHIWSMGTAYQIADDGANFGNLYGFAYKHTNNTTGGTMAGGHQAVWCVNGTPKVAMGENLWTSGSTTTSNIIVSSTEAVKHLAFSRGNFNYITAPASGHIAFVVNGKGIGDTTSDLIIQNGQVRPGTNNATSLGLASYRWSNTYTRLLNVAGAATLSGAVSMSSTLSVSSTSTFTGRTTHNGGITATSMILSGTGGEVLKFTGAASRKIWFPGNTTDHWAGIEALYAPVSNLGHNIQLNIQVGIGAIQLSSTNGTLLIVGQNEIRANGVLHNTTGMYSDGYMSSKGQNTSDVRLKTDIKSFNATSIIKSLRPVSFKWNDVARKNSKVFDTDEVQYGLIAQEVKAVAPWAAVDDMFKDGYMGVRYEKFIPVLMKAQIETIDEVTDLKRRLSAVERENEKLRKEIQTLKAA